MNAPNEFEFVSPPDSIAFEPTEFLFTLQSCMDMAVRPSLFNRPAEYSISITDKEGGITQYGFSDAYMNRFGLAVSQRYQKDSRKYFSFMHRCAALMKLVHSGALDHRYCRRGVEDSELANEVFELAASFPLNADGQFSRDAFLSALKEG